MTRRYVFFASFLMASLSALGHAHAQTPGQIPVFVDTVGTLGDSNIAQAIDGNIVVSITTADPALSVSQSSPFSTDAIFGQSANGNGVHGTSESGASSGVAGVNNNTNDGYGVYGFSAGWGVYGQSTSGVSGNRAGVTGVSTGAIGIGVYGSTVAGIGVYGISSDPAGYAGVFQGLVKVNVLGTGGSTSLCRNGALEIAICSSSLRYKTEVRPFGGGLEIVKRLRPIAFTWKQGGLRDVGLAAEDVEQVEPLLTFRNDNGEIEGVKYNQLSAVFVNAFAEQEAQIQRQQEQVNALKALVCQSHPDADICR